MYLKAFVKAVFLIFVAFVLTCYASAASAGFWGGDKPSDWGNLSIVVCNDEECLAVKNKSKNDRNTTFGEFMKALQSEAEKQDKEEGYSTTITWETLENGFKKMTFKLVDPVTEETNKMIMLFDEANLSNGNTYVFFERMFVSGMGEVGVDFMLDYVYTLVNE